MPRRLIRHFQLRLAALVLKALAKHPADGFASAHDVQRALDMALPASQRLTTDAEVAAFMHHLLSERNEQRKAALKMALRVADERAQGRTASPSQSEISHTGFTPPSQISSLKVPREIGSGYPKQRDSGAPPET